MKLPPTELLYERDSFLREFTATVVDVRPCGDLYRVALDRTAFFPEGGGQPADTGTLGEASVTDTQIDQGVVLHTADRPLAVGATVHGAIDWAARFDRMQNHSGEHIVSGLVRKLYGFHNVGFHMGSDCVTMDFDGMLTEQDLDRIEQLANEAVFADLPLQALYPTGDQLAELDYRSKIELEGDVRLIRVPGYDLCACCGTHVQRTGQIGIIKLLYVQKYKKGVRVGLLAGNKALADYREKHRTVVRIAASLSAKQPEAALAVRRLLDERDTLRRALYQQREQAFADKIEALPKDIPMVCLFERDLSPDSVRRFCLLLSQTYPLAAVFSATDGTQERPYAIGSKTMDVRPLGRQLNRAFAGRGGGSAELVQGIVTGTQPELEDFMDRQFANLQEEAT
jgi:alanyl-tRNA synthetase